ncbi:hypothetical protein GEMRC1_013095 [Eukaryota sp. GEM-RC1]
MLERFNLTYGPPEDVVIGYGDWSSKGKTRKSLSLERSKTQTTDLESGKDTLARDQKKKKTATKKEKTSTGKARKKPTCGNCGQEGHNKTSCKNPPKEMSSPKRRSVKSVKKKKLSRKGL